MRFTVTWRPQALNSLAKLWLDGDDAEAVRQAADQLDAELRDDAHAKGLPMWQDRLLANGPLVVAYSVSLDDRLVNVWDVWHR